ncbi:MAG: tRNA lysidine(34) synthetase TilS [Gammaproteobacteria bacterium]|jgi:tRNA(Ile)-lysidine synthase
MALTTPHAKVVQSVLSCLNNDKDIKRYWIAYSGGIDSHVLLHAISSHRHHFPQVSFHAVHINHALNRQADQWAEHCRKISEQLKIPYLDIDVDATPAAGESPEARAREVRYQALVKLIKPGDCLLTAHHQDDQVETLLLQLMRGSGPKGLAAMPRWTAFGLGRLARPLMQVRREDIHTYAIANQLNWIHDESNLDTRFDRNFIRHEVVPKLLQRWPSLAQTVTRSARYCAEAAELMDDAAQSILDILNPGGGSGLPVSGLMTLSQIQQRNVLRYWIHKSGYNTPSSAQLQQLVDQVLLAAPDSMPRITWEGCEVRRYRGQLYIMSPLHPVPAGKSIPWNLEEPLQIGGIGVLSAQHTRGRGVATHFVKPGAVTVGFRRGGETIQPLGRTQHHVLKKLFQEQGIPPWIRDRVPLVYIGGELAAVGEWFVSHPFAAQADEPGIVFQWLAEQDAGSARLPEV